MHTCAWFVSVEGVVVTVHHSAEEENHASLFLFFPGRFLSVGIYRRITTTHQKTRWAAKGGPEDEQVPVGFGKTRGLEGTENFGGTDLSVLERQIYRSETHHQVMREKTAD